MLLETIRQALDTMRLHRRWAALTMFGIVWGTASVVLLVGWGVGAHRMTDTGLQKVGKNLVFIMAGRVGEDLSPADERRVLHLEMPDVAALRGAARRIEIAGAEILMFMLARHAAESRSVDVRGIEPVMQQLRGVSVAAGRFISAADVRFQRRVAVIGQTARQRLFGPRPVLGERLDLNGRSFEVIGLLNRVGTQLSRNRTETDEQVWIPLTTAQVLGDRGDYVDMIVARPPDRRFNDDLKREARAILARRLHVAPTDEEAVFIISMIDILSGFDSVFAFMNVFFFVLAATTLFIGGIGVMNMMLVSVNERRREIGLRLAVGARQRDVVGQFLVETLVITLVGGAAGIGLGLLGCVMLGLAQNELIPVPVIIPQVVVLAIVVTTAVGVLSGIGPAWRAAGVDPAETLRVE
jgi:putative ABC transport system permease protein